MTRAQVENAAAPWRRGRLAGSAWVAFLAAARLAWAEVTFQDAAGRQITVPPARVERVFAWDPEVIGIVDPNFYAAVWSDPTWAGVPAVRSGRVHLSPHLPFGWVDFPPGVSRVMGVRWLAAVLYPERFPGDLRRETEEFYHLFYHRPPDPALLAPERPPR